MTQPNSASASGGAVGGGGTGRAGSAAGFQITNVAKPPPIVDPSKQFALEMAAKAGESVDRTVERAKAYAEFLGPAK